MPSTSSISETALSEARGSPSISKLATYRLYWDWDGDGDFSEDSENLSTHRRYTVIKRGCAGSPIASRDIAGELYCEMDNSGEEFSKGNTESAYYGYIQPGELVKFTMQIGDGAEVTIFQGDLEDIMAQPSSEKVECKAIFTAKGVINRLSGEDVPVAAYTNTASGTLVGHILDAISYPAGDRDIDTGQSTIGRYSLQRVTEAISAIRDIENAEYGKMRETKDGKLLYEDRAHRLSSPHTVSQATYNPIAGGSIRSSSIIPIDTKNDVYKTFTTRISTADVTSDQQLWELTGYPPAIANGATLYFTIHPPGRGRHGFYSSAAWSTVSHEANTQADGGGADVTGQVPVVQTKYGDRQKLAITNNSGGTAYIISLTANGTANIETNPGEVSETSSATMAKGTWPYRSSLISAVAEGTGWCGHGKALYGVLRQGLDISLDANASLNNLVEAQRADLSDRITVTDAAQYINTDFWIESIRHEIDEQGRHFVDLQCAEIVTHTWAASAGDDGGNTVSGVIVADDLDVDLDDVPDGIVYARPRYDGLTGGYFRLDTGVGDIDDIADGTTYARMRAIAVYDGRARFDQAYGDLDDVGDGTTYARPRADQLDGSGYIRRARSAASGARFQIDETDGIRAITASDLTTLQIGVNGWINIQSDVSGARIQIDLTNGIRGFDSSDNLVTQLNPTTGILAFASAATGARVTFDATNGLRGIDSSANTRVKIDPSGFLYCREIYAIDENSIIDLDLTDQIKFTLTGQNQQIRMAMNGVLGIWAYDSTIGSPDTYLVLSGQNNYGVQLCTDTSPAPNPTVHVDVTPTAVAIKNVSTGLTLEAGDVIQIGGTTVLSGKMSHESDPSGGTTVDTECRATVASLIDKLKGIDIMNPDP